MSVSGEIDDETDLYCKPEDVARFIRPRVVNTDGGVVEAGDTTAANFRDATHPEGATKPTRSEVLKHIESASVRMERKTQQAWRANRVRRETHDHKGIYYWLSGHPIDLVKRNIRPINSDKGDKIEVWTGNTWEEWASNNSYEYGRDEDYWVDGPNGLLWIYERAIIRPHPKFRITYRYGYDMVPHDIRDAVAKRAAAAIITGDFYGTTAPGNNQGENSDPAAAAETWREEFRKVANDYKKVSFV